MTEFNKYLKEARQEFCKELNKYNVSDNLQLRTACDSFLIAFDQATEKAINYTRCSTLLKDKETMTFTEWIESNKGYIINGDVFNEHDYQQNRNELVKRYNKIHNL